MRRRFVLERAPVLQNHRQRLERCDLRNDRACRVVAVLRVAHIADVAEIGLGIREVVGVERDFGRRVLNAEAKIHERVGWSDGLRSESAIEQRHTVARVAVVGRHEPVDSARERLYVDAAERDGPGGRAENARPGLQVDAWKPERARIGGSAKYSLQSFRGPVQVRAHPCPVSAPLGPDKKSSHVLSSRISACVGAPIG